MIKEIYVVPEIEAIAFDSEDIITTSGVPGSGENETPVAPW